MVRSIEQPITGDIIRVANDDAPNQPSLVVIRYETRRTTDLSAVLRKERMGSRVFTTLTVPFPIGVAMNMLLVQHFEGNPPIVDEEYLKNRALGIKISDDRSAIAFTMMRKLHKDDVDENDVFQPRINHGIIDGALVVDVHLIRETAWGICTIFTGKDFLGIVTTILDAIEEARTTTPQ